MPRSNLDIIINAFLRLQIENIYLSTFCCGEKMKICCNSERDECAAEHRGTIWVGDQSSWVIHDNSHVTRVLKASRVLRREHQIKHIWITPISKFINSQSASFDRKGGWRHALYFLFLSRAFNWLNEEIYRRFSRSHGDSLILVHMLLAQINFNCVHLRKNVHKLIYRNCLLMQSQSSESGWRELTNARHFTENSWTSPSRVRTKTRLEKCLIWNSNLFSM